MVPRQIFCASYMVLSHIKILLKLLIASVLDTLTRFPVFCSFGDTTKHHLQWIRLLRGSVIKHQRSILCILFFLTLSFVAATAVQHNYCPCLMHWKNTVMYLWNKMHLTQGSLTLQWQINFSFTSFEVTVWKRFIIPKTLPSRVLEKNTSLGKLKIPI